MNSKHFDVIVIGGGHAGAEAACASARMGAKTALITQKIATIGEMSCNPAIGGLGKGHLVREIDALDGILGRCADLGSIQFRMLNQSKGPAVRGPRAQCDRILFKQAVQETVKSQENLEIIEATVAELVLERNKITGVKTEEGQNYRAGAVIITTGTFLNGLIHLGPKQWPAGRMGDEASKSLAKSLYSLGLDMGRLKTGTPSRINGDTIDYSVCEIQNGDENPESFSFLHGASKNPQLPCHITWTTEKTHQIIRDNIHLAAINTGAISGRGPRYCPSIEDKISRFADKSRHQIFLEPEGLSTNWVYPNGISTSFDEVIQEQFLRSIPGLENIEIFRWAYAIEYDFVSPKELNHDLMVRKYDGLFLAGQINGTTGYEEAAAQGLVAGLNAALYVAAKQNFTFSRANSYIGVMIDDLVTRGVSEPYRMFTSRAEYRLSLRADNADMRLTPIGIELGLVKAYREKAFSAKMAEQEKARAFCLENSLSSHQAANFGAQVRQDGKKRNIFDLLALRDFDYDRISEIFPQLKEFSITTRAFIENEAAYSGYLNRQRDDIASFERESGLQIPQSLNFRDIPGLSNEVCEKLKKGQPRTVKEAGALEGITAGAMAALIAYLKNFAAKAA